MSCGVDQSPQNHVSPQSSSAYKPVRNFSLQRNLSNPYSRTVVSQIVEQKTTKRGSDTAVALSEEVNKYKGDFKELFGISPKKLKNIYKKINDLSLKLKSSKLLESLITLHIFATDICDRIKNNPKKCCN